MKHRKYTAALLSLSLLLTGCGGASTAESDNTETVATESAETEPLHTEMETTYKQTEIFTTSSVTTETTSQAVTKTAAATEAQHTRSATEAHTEQQVQHITETSTAEHTEQNNDSSEQDISDDSEATTTTTAETTTTAITATTAITTPAMTTTTTTKVPLPKTVLDGMTLEQKVGQMFMVTPEALTGVSTMTEVGNGTRNAIKEVPVGGIIYFAKNMTSQKQMKKIISSTQDYAVEACGIGLFTAVDEEGGDVARCAQKLGTTKFENMAHYGKENDSKTAYKIGSTIGKDLKALGFNVDFAPVADVNICSSNELGERIFSDDPNVVANMASYVVKGLQDEGVCATLKHFPGLGAEKGNTHTNSTVVIERSLEELRQTEFIPFAEGINAGADFVLVGHQTVTGFDDDLPCDLSYKAVTEMLRGELGFEGIAITDSQQMNTISKVYTSGEAAKLSIKAGIDIILMPVDYREAVNAVCEAVRSGEIPEKRIDESVMRILRKKYDLGLLKK